MNWDTESIASHLGNFLDRIVFLKYQFWQQVINPSWVRFASGVVLKYASYSESSIRFYPWIFSRFQIPLLLFHKRSFLHIWRRAVDLGKPRLRKLVVQPEFWGGWKFLPNRLWEFFREFKPLLGHLIFIMFNSSRRINALGPLCLWQCFHF